MNFQTDRPYIKFSVEQGIRSYSSKPDEPLPWNREKTMGMVADRLRSLDPETCTSEQVYECYFPTPDVHKHLEFKCSECGDKITSWVEFRGVCEGDPDILFCKTCIEQAVRLFQ